MSWDMFTEARIIKLLVYTFSMKSKFVSKLIQLHAVMYARKGVGFFFIRLRLLSCCLVKCGKLGSYDARTPTEISHLFSLWKITYGHFWLLSRLWWEYWCSATILLKTNSSYLSRETLNFYVTRETEKKIVELMSDCKEAEPTLN